MPQYNMNVKKINIYIRLDITCRIHRKSFQIFYPLQILS